MRGGIAIGRTAWPAHHWDVAELAGVSIATVSRYMNGTQAVSKAASNAIAKAMAQLDYVPNANVRSIKLGQTRTVGIIVPDISNFFRPGSAAG